jgi:hypothetical protein
LQPSDVSATLHIPPLYVNSLTQSGDGIHLVDQSEKSRRIVKEQFARRSSLDMRYFPIVHPIEVVVRFSTEDDPCLLYPAPETCLS